MQGNTEKILFGANLSAAVRRHREPWETLGVSLGVAIQWRRYASMSPESEAFEASPCVQAFDGGVTLGLDRHASLAMTSRAVGFHSFVNLRLLGASAVATARPSC